MLIGFSTGSLYQNVDPVSRQAIDLIRKVGCNAIELNAGRSENLDKLDQIYYPNFEGFSHVSLHAPFDTLRKNTQKTIEELTKYQTRFEFRGVVLHPAKKINHRQLIQTKLPLCFENMEDTKDFGKTVEDIETLLAKGDYGLVLDLMHAFTNDPSMQLVKGFYNIPMDRIIEYHVSGYDAERTDGSRHCRLSKTKQKEILETIILPIPVIIESVFPEYDSIKELEQAMRTEVDYIRECLDKQ